MRWTRAAAVAFACCAPDAQAYKIFQEKLPNGGNVPGVAALGHDRPDSGGPNNDFGMDFIGAMFKWTKEFCMKDSDGDGQTNGQELGDPCCEFEHRKNEKVRWTEGVSHPGDPEFKSDPKLWEGIVCGEEEEVATEPEVKETEVAEAEVEEPEATEEKVEKEEMKLQTVDLSVGAPMMRSSMMLSAVALTVLVVYFVAMRMGRRSTRNLPIFRQRRGLM